MSIMADAPGATKLGKRFLTLFRRNPSGAKVSQVFPECDAGEAPSVVGLDSFEVLRLLGKGSFAKVYLVRRRDTGKTYAMKVMEKEAIFRKQQLEHTLTECHILQTEKHLLLIMDYMPGGELFFHLKRSRRFTEERARLYLAELVLALGHLHSLGIIYRDLKPENILLDAKGHVHIADFGLAKEHVLDNQSASTFCGTPEYLAPEILKAEGHGRAVDWWSLGILLYEMLVGIPPFYDKNISVMYKRILNDDLFFPSRLSQPAQDLILKLLERDPDARLGAGRSDSEEIVQHPFFRGLNWEAVQRKEVRPQFVPMVQAADDTSNFETECTQIPVDALSHSLCPGKEMQRYHPVVW